MVLLCDGPKPQNSMMSGFSDPWNPVFMDLNTPKYFKKSKKRYGNIFETYDVYKSGDHVFSKIVESLCTVFFVNVFSDTITGPYVFF